MRRILYDDMITSVVIDSMERFVRRCKYQAHITAGPDRVRHGLLCPFDPCHVYRPLRREIRVPELKPLYDIFFAVDDVYLYRQVFM
jgi:hypothetical protein